jgi:hypothetical protein
MTKQFSAGLVILLFFVIFIVNHNHNHDQLRNHPGRCLYYAGAFWLYLHSHCTLQIADCATRNVQRDFGFGFGVRVRVACSVCVLYLYACADNDNDNDYG